MEHRKINKENCMKLHDFKSPNFWVQIASIIAVCGLIVFVCGWIGQVAWMKLFGALLFTPLIVGGLILIGVVIPILIIANRNNK
jgi:hypothetical protein